jgi:hypothetical protein
MFTLSRTVLLMCMRTGNMVCDPNILEERV